MGDAGSHRRSIQRHPHLSFHQTQHVGWQTADYILSGRHWHFRLGDRSCDSRSYWCRYSKLTSQEVSHLTDYGQSGLSENIRVAYSFICNNYAPGDEIILIGFSRGAFTARSIAALIYSVGLLTPHGLQYFYQIFKDWENHAIKGWQTPFKNEPWPDRPNITKPEYGQKLEEVLWLRSLSYSSVQH